MKYIDVPSVTAIIQYGALNREGLIADVLFPPVESECKFSIIDWNLVTGLTGTDDVLSCHGDVKEINTEGFELLHFATKDRGNAVPLTECCIAACGKIDIKEKIENSKMVNVMDNLLINREKRAVTLATDESKYTDNTTKKPGDTGAVNEGGLYKLALADLKDQTKDMLKYFQPIQAKNFLTGVRNIAVMTQSVADLFISHKSFIGHGCAVAPETSLAQVASLLKVEKIVIADAGFNNAVAPGTVNVQGIWPENYILFAASHKLSYTAENKPTFGLSPYTENMSTNYWVDPKKGKGKGVVFGKITHDITEQVATYKAATLVKLTV